MASTTFTDGVTVVEASWLNDVNTTTYTTIPDIISGSQAVGLANTATSATNATNLTGAGTISSTTTATTQTAGNNSTKVATTAYVDSAISAGGGSYVTLTGNQTIAGTKTFSSMPVMPIQSMVRLNTGNGYGSTSTKVRRFTTTVTNQGTDITYSDSATLGASFTINTSGVYSICYADNFNNADIVGLSLNASSGATAILSLPVSEVLCSDATAGANYTSSTAVTLYLPSSSVVRPHTNGGIPTGSGTNQVQFVITRVA